MPSFFLSVDGEPFVFLQIRGAGIACSSFCIVVAFKITVYYAEKFNSIKSQKEMLTMDETRTKIVLAVAGTGLALWGIHKWLKHVRKAEPKLCARHDNLVEKLPIPEDLECPIGTSSVFFGISPKDSSKQICKPIDKDGHVGVFGESSRGKTTGIVIPTMKMFSGAQFILDTKGTLPEQWRQCHQGSSRVLKEFRCSALDENPYWIDLFEPMRQDPENASGHAWDLAEALLPVIPGTLPPSGERLHKIF